MRFSVLAFGLSVLALILLAFLWGSGGFEQISAWAANWQREVQTSMARGLRALKAGEPGALAALLTICFSYGFFHAVGPGHGKVLIGGYALARRAALIKMAAVAVISSLAQGATAIALVYAGVTLLNLTRQQMVGLAEDWFADASYVAIALVGIWLMWRGLRKLTRKSVNHAHHHHDHDSVCTECGHRHAPDLHEVEAAGSWKALLALIASIAIRPCTGALFVLILTWRMDLIWQGIAGVVAMAMGTASVTVATAVLAVGVRQGLFGAALERGGGLAAHIVPAIELAVGLTIAIISLSLLGLI